MEVKSLYCNGKFLKYKLTLKNIKKIYLRVENNGEIKVSAPLFISIREIEKFLYEQMEFIENSIKRTNNNTIFNLNNGVVSILGIVFEVKKTLSTKNSIKIDDGKIIIQYKKHEDIKNLIRKILKKQAVFYFGKRIKEISNEIGISYNELKVKWLKTKWGHCDSNKSIVLNCKLISYQPKVIDYVIIHELCHIIYMNHSKEYWNLVNKYCPNWKHLKIELKK